MSIEFATSMNDYNFSGIPEKMLTALKETMSCTMLYERVKIFQLIKAKDLIENQNYWRLI